MTETTDVVDRQIAAFRDRDRVRVREGLTQDVAFLM